MGKDRRSFCSRVRAVRGGSCPGFTLAEWGPRQSSSSRDRAARLALRFGIVKRHVGRGEQTGEIAAMLRSKRDANAGADRRRDAVAKLIGGRQFLDQPIG